MEHIEFDRKDTADNVFTMLIEIHEGEKNLDSSSNATEDRGQSFNAA